MHLQWSKSTFPRVALVLVLAGMFPVRAWGQPPPACVITGPKEAPCSAQLCGPVGNFGYEWHSAVKGFPGATTQCITVTESGTYTLVLTDPATGRGISKCNHTVFIDKCGPNREPDCSRARAKNAVLWPPNHQLEPVEIEGVVDPDGDPISITAFSITQDEPIESNGDGETCADGDIQDGQAYVRSERTGVPENPGNGRVYVITFVAVDARGAKCKGQVTVCVPHDMGQGDTCVDDGQIHDSLGDCPL